MTFKVCRNCYRNVGLRRRVCPNRGCRGLLRAAAPEEIREEEVKVERSRQLLRELLEQHRENPPGL